MLNERKPTKKLVLVQGLSKRLVRSANNPVNRQFFANSPDSDFGAEKSHMKTFVSLDIS